jgi:hypothetical protein
VLSLSKVAHESHRLYKRLTGDGAKVSRNFAPPPMDLLSSWGGQRTVPADRSAGGWQAIAPGGDREPARLWTCFPEADHSAGRTLTMPRMDLCLAQK